MKSRLRFWTVSCAGTFFAAACALSPGLDLPTKDREGDDAASGDDSDFGVGDGGLGEDGGSAPDDTGGATGLCAPDDSWNEAGPGGAGGCSPR